MCGICGIVQPGGQVAERVIKLMANTLIHRGPDDDGYFIDGEVGLGFRRLKIIDLHKGAQPMANEDGTIWLVFNGEIYNYRELRADLISRGHKFLSRSDSEVIIHLYEEMGEETVSRLRGMFAFVIWDSRKKILYGARDRFGIKPFYYTQRKNRFVFASEIKAMLAAERELPEIDPESFCHYLTFQYVPEPRTIYQNIFTLPPAHCFTYSGGKLKLRRYWEVKFKPGNESFTHYCNALAEKLRETVRLHTNSDVPWGAFLSGGIDSTIITALVKEINSEVNTFSVGYEEKKYSELEEAEVSARYLGTNHHQYAITAEDFADNLPRLLWHFDQPVADPAAISLYFVARMAREKITVTLSGEGADEVFAGYGIYREPYALQPFRRLPRPLQSCMTYAAGFLPDGFYGKGYIYRAATPLSRRYVGNAFIFGPEEKERLMNPEIANVPHQEITDLLFSSAARYDEVTQMQYIDVHTWLPGDILLKADKMTMANSLELRVPFLDHELFELAAAIPTRFKIKGKMTKYLLRQTFKDAVPPEAVNRPKRGFPVPTRVWLRQDPFKTIAGDLIASEAAGIWFNRNEIRKMYARHLRGDADYSRKLWTVLMFLMWHNQIYQSGRGSFTEKMDLQEETKL